VQEANVNIYKVVFSGIVATFLLFGLAPTAPSASADGPVEHCVPKGSSCSGKTFYCEATKQSLTNPGYDGHANNGDAICCWRHYHN
jgi:hypothetical protein